MKITKNLKVDFLRLFAPKARPAYAGPEKSTFAGDQKLETGKVDFSTLFSLFAPRTMPVAGAT